MLYSGQSNPLVKNQPPREHQTTEEKYWLGLQTVRATWVASARLHLARPSDGRGCRISQDSPALEDPKGDPFKAAKNGYDFFKQLQSEDGHWSAEYGGPLFLVCRLTRL